MSRPRLTCLSCRHFEDDPGVIEAEFPYITTFGSAYSAARGEAGICGAHGTFLDPMDAGECAEFEAPPRRASGAGP